MVGRYRGDDSDDDDSSLEEGHTRSRHPRHRSKTSIDREIHDRDLKRSDEDRRNHNGDREVRDERHRDSSSRRYDDKGSERHRDSGSRRYDDKESERRDRDSRRRRNRDASESEEEAPKSIDPSERHNDASGRRRHDRAFPDEDAVKVAEDGERKDRDTRRGKYRELSEPEEEIPKTNSVDRYRDSSGRRRHDKGSSKSEEDAVKVSKDSEIRDRRDGRQSEKRDRDLSESEEEVPKSKMDPSGRYDHASDRRRHDKALLDEAVVKVSEDSERRERDTRRGKDRDLAELEKEIPKSNPVDRQRDSSRRRRHDKGSPKSEEDAVKVSKDSEIRERRDDRESERRDRDSRRRRNRDSSESDGEIPKNKMDRKDRYKDSTSTRRPERDIPKSDEDVMTLSKNKILEDGEIRDGRDMDINQKKRRHDRDSWSSDEDLDENSKKKGKNQNGGRETFDVRGRDSSRTDDILRHENGKRKESHGRLSEDEEDLKDRKHRREVETSREEDSSRRRRSDEHHRDSEREKKFEKKSDDYDDRPRRHRGSEEENKVRRPFLDRVPEKDYKKNLANPKNPELGTYAALGEKGLNTDAAAVAGKTGGVYIPPFKLAQMMKDVEDKSSREYQRLTWDALRKSINGLVNKVNAANLKNIVTELFEENLIRGRGLFCRSCMKSQMASPGFTDVFSALVAVVNTKFPQIGELLLIRVVLQLKRAYKRNDKHQLLASVKFIAHLVNQQVSHEIIALELLTVLLETPSDDSVEVAVGFVTECGALLQDLSPQGLQGIFERFRGILHEGEIDKRVQFLIEGLFAVRRAKFQGHVAVRPELDLVDPEDQITHEISLEDELDPETTLDIFREDPDFLENEKRYEALVKDILGDESGKDESSSSEEEDSDEDKEDSDEEDEESMQIKDETETNLVNLRRTIYLTIMSSVDFEEAGHKLLKIKLEPGQEMELCIMLLECCSQERTYLRYYGLLGQRFCMINKIHQENFEKCFVQQYSMIHRLETNKLRNVAKFFAHLLGTDALPWHVLSYIRLTEEDTTSSSRIFIKILFQELSEHLGIRLLNERLTDPTMQDSFDSIFPKDNPKNTRFSINFFTSIGLGGITENLREYLKNMPRLIMQQQVPDEDDENSDSSGGGDSSAAELSESESESSEEERRKKRKKRRH